MGWVVYYSVLTFIFACSYLIPSSVTHVSPDLIKGILLGVSLMTALGQAIARVNLRFYLFWQKVWVWWNSGSTTIWRFGLRLDGNVDFDALVEALGSAEFAEWTTVIAWRRANEVRIKVDRTIHLLLSFDPSETSGDGDDHITIRSEELEVPYGSARSKIDKCITPLIGAIVRVARPTNYSVMFDVIYRDHNLFFAFYVAHLSPKQVTHFNLVFRPTALSRTGTEKVIVTQHGLEITASSAEGFGELSKAFLLLSSHAVEAVQTG